MEIIDKVLDLAILAQPSTVWYSPTMQCMMCFFRIVLLKSLRNYLFILTVT